MLFPNIVYPFKTPGKLITTHSLSINFLRPHSDNNDNLETNSNSIFLTSN
jgi:hypothetical protein